MHKLSNGIAGATQSSYLVKILYIILHQKYTLVL